MSYKYLVVLFIVFLFALAYIYCGTHLGIGISCTDKKIVGIKTTPPALMAIIQPTICQVELKANINNTTVCSGKRKIKNYEKGIFPCSSIKHYSKEWINVSAIFYTADGNQEIGRDNKLLRYMPK